MPILKHVESGLEVAPIGLASMYNSGGSLAGVELDAICTSTGANTSGSEAVRLPELGKTHALLVAVRRIKRMQSRKTKCDYIVSTGSIRQEQRKVLAYTRDILSILTCIAECCLIREVI